MAELDKLFKQGRTSEVPQFLEENIEKALDERNNEAALSLYNECMGFYRETGMYDKSIESCTSAVALMYEMGIEGTMPYATTLLNVANAYRAAGRLSESLEIYNRVRPVYMEMLMEDDMHFAGLYNNLSLLYQEMGDFKSAKEQLENALKIVSSKEDAQFETAVTNANLANTCIELGQDEEAKSRALEAIRIFEAAGIDDAHYSAALSALGSIYYMDRDYPHALEIMKKSRACVKKYLGDENTQYQRLSENIEIIEEKIKKEKERDIEKILGIDIDKDGWTSVIKAGKQKKDAADKKEIKERVLNLREKENMAEKETSNQAEHAGRFNINQAFADIRAAAKEKIDKQRIEEEQKQAQYEEDKAVDAMMAEVMDEIAVEVEEEEYFDEPEEYFDEASEAEDLSGEEFVEESGEINASKDPFSEIEETKEIEEPSGEEYALAEKIEKIEEITQAILESEETEQVEPYEDLTPEIKGLELCRLYYEEYGRSMITEKFGRYEDKIATGLVGKGSDCFGFDDKQSGDHDFGPRFFMWVTKEVYDKIGSELAAEYEKLPKEYMGIARTETAQGKDRAGVMVIEDFYKDIIGVDLIGALTKESKALTTVKSWLAAHDYSLAAAVNGEVFRDDEGIFTSYRELIKGYYPKAVWYRKISQACALFSQNGQYNLPRMRKRGQLVAAELAKAECARQAMKLNYLLNKTYAPHDKWLFKAMPDNPGMVYSNEGEPDKNVSELIEEISLTSVGRAHEKQLEKAIESLALIFANELERQSMAGSANIYLDANTAELTSKSDALLTAMVADAPTIKALALTIAKAEFEAFDKVKNEGGRADCQNNWPIFKVMRMSQYMTWNEDMLLQYLYEFRTNYDKGRNMIEEKYARMMESTAPLEYEKFADKLPEISEEKREIMEQIIELQVKWMEEFAKQYPQLAASARTIHTAEDLPYDTSYETYLRGELGTYSDRMLEMYGRYIVEHARGGKSVAREIMANTIQFYGYSTFDEAENKTH